jgi:hypothetical protein
MVLAYSDKISRVSPYSFLSEPKIYNYGTFTLFGRLSQVTSFYFRFLTLDDSFGLLQFRSSLLSESFLYFLFLQVLRYFNSLGIASSFDDSNSSNY